MLSLTSGPLILLIRHTELDHLSMQVLVINNHLGYISGLFNIFCPNTFIHIKRKIISQHISATAYTHTTRLINETSI